MDLSRLKWPIIVLVVIGLCWAVSDGGVSFWYNKLMEYSPGQDAEKDSGNELALSKVGAFLLKTFRYQRAYQVFEATIDRYPDGANALYNRYRMAKCAEKMDRNAESVRILRELIRVDAHAKDERVPNDDILKLRADKLMEMHELGEI